MNFWKKDWLSTKRWSLYRDISGFRWLPKFYWQVGRIDPRRTEYTYRDDILIGTVQYSSRMPSGLAISWLGRWSKFLWQPLKPFSP